MEMVTPKDILQPSSSGELRISWQLLGVIIAFGSDLACARGIYKMATVTALDGGFLSRFFVRLKEAGWITKGHACAGDLAPEVYRMSADGLVAYQKICSLNLRLDEEDGKFIFWVEAESSETGPVQEELLDIPSFLRR